MKTIAFLIAWTIKIVAMIGICVAVVLMSPMLIGAWAMNKTFGDDGW